MADLKITEMRLRKAASNQLTDGQETRLKRPKTERMSAGTWVFIPQNNFAVVAEYNGQNFSSPRFVCAKIDGNKVVQLRTFKVSDFTSMAYSTLAPQTIDGVTTPTATPVVKESDLVNREINGVTVRRLPRSVRPFQGMLGVPPMIVEDHRAKITTPFVLEFGGYADATSPTYAQVGNSGVYDIVVNNGEVVFDVTDLLMGKISDKAVAQSLVDQIREAIATDAYWNELTEGCLL